MSIDYNTLLNYLSFKEEGSWENFKAYANNLDYNNNESEFLHYYSRLTLNRLGHIEFLFNGERIWKVCKSCISIIPGTYLGILAGYRTSNFFLDLKDYCKKNDILYSQQENFQAPDLISLNFKEPSKLEKFRIENSLHIDVTENFAQKMLFLTKNIKEYTNNLVEYTGNPENLSLKYFETHKFQYLTETAKFGDKEGLYRYGPSYNKSNLLYRNGKWLFIEENIGKFVAFNIVGKTNLIKYDEKKNLIVPRSIRFPELIDRALCSFSGLNPKIENRNLVYSNIDCSFARDMANKLGQKLVM